MATLSLVLHFIASHPGVVLGVLTAWQIFSAVVTAIFKPRTPEEREKFKAVAPAWLFALVAFCETVGLDLPGFIHLVDPLVRAVASFLGLRGVDNVPPSP